MLNANAAKFSVFADYHATAFKQVHHRGDGFFAVAGAGSYDGHKVPERVFGAVDFFVYVFHGVFHLIDWTTTPMPMFKIFCYRAIFP
jgi:hypothetical protein